jgi:FtsH-binding integral membrane protein
MSEHRHFLSIWLFIGTLVLVYGLLILGSGIYELSHPLQKPLAELHAPIWWGALLIVLGVVYILIFRPRREK